MSTPTAFIHLQFASISYRPLKMDANLNILFRKSTFSLYKYLSWLDFAVAAHIQQVQAEGRRLWVR